MAEQLTTPRITAPYLSAFASKIVMLWGKVIQLRGEEAIIDSDGTVQLILNRVSPISVEHAPLGAPPRPELRVAPQLETCHPDRDSLVKIETSTSIWH